MVDLLEARRRILLNTPHLESLSGDTASFETDMTSKLKECKIHFTPIQEGSGDPSPDNVRPIHGWDGVTVNLTGKNLFDASGEYLNNKWINNNGEIVDSLKNRPTLLYTQKIPVVSGTDYTIHGACNNIQYIRVVYYDENDNFLGRVVSDGKPNPSKKFKPIIGTAYVLVNPDTAIQNIQLEKGSSPTTYEPFGQSLTISFPQTIYGGYVDLAKGEVVEEWAKWVEDGSRTPSYWVWKKDDANAVYTALMPALPVGSRHNGDFGFIEKVMCPNRHYVSITGSRVRTPNIISLYRSQNSASFAYSFTGEEFSSMTKAELKAYIAENPIEAVYILLTPRVYPLDPVTIRTLKGLNNIWSDANGNIEVKYWTH